MIKTVTFSTTNPVDSFGMGTQL